MVHETHDGSCAHMTQGHGGVTTKQGAWEELGGQSLPHVPQRGCVWTPNTHRYRCPSAWGRAWRPMVHETHDGSCAHMTQGHGGVTTKQGAWGTTDPVKASHMYHSVGVCGPPTLTAGFFKNESRISSQLEPRITNQLDTPFSSCTS